MTSFETEDLLQQMDIQQLEREIRKSQLETKALVGDLGTPGAFFHWISIGISALITFVVTVTFVFFLRRYFRIQKCRAPTAPRMDQQMALMPPQPPMDPRPPMPVQLPNNPNIIFPRH